MGRKSLRKISNLSIRLLLIIVIALSISIIFDVFSNKEFKSNGNPQTVESPQETTTLPNVQKELLAHNTTILAKSKMVEDSYFDNCVFIGDSRTIGLQNVNVIPTENIFAVNGISHVAYQSHYFSDTTTGSYGTIGTILSARQPEYIYVALGINGVGFMDADSFMEQYQTLINTIIVNAPNSNIIIESIIPVSNYYEQNNPTLTNAKIDTINDHLLILATELDLKYLNVSEVFTDDFNNGLSSLYDSGDGLHFNETGIRAIIDYIKTHSPTN